MNVIIDIQNVLIENSSLDLCKAIPSATEMQKWITRALHRVNFHADEVELTVRITDKEEIRSLNAEYRGKDKPTNILSFPFEAPPEFPCNLLGDLVVCAEVVEEEAVEQKKLLSDHWAHMLIHGTLHLVGYDHIEEQEAEEMESIEICVLADLGISNPYLLD